MKKSIVHLKTLRVVSVSLVLILFLSLLKVTPVKAYYDEAEYFTYMIMWTPDGTDYYIDTIVQAQVGGHSDGYIRRGERFMGITDTTDGLNFSGQVTIYNYAATVKRTGEFIGIDALADLTSKATAVHGSGNICLLWDDFNDDVDGSEAGTLVSLINQNLLDIYTFNHHAYFETTGRVLYDYNIIQTSQVTFVPAYETFMSDDGRGTATVSQDLAYEGKDVTITAHPDPYYRFKQWHVLSGGIELEDEYSASTVFYMGTEDVYIQAEFERIPEPDYLDELRTKLSIARSIGGPQTVTWDKGTSLPYDIMKTLQDNPDITLVFSYTYEGKDYVTTIPGKDVTADITIDWYGPVYLDTLFNNPQLPHQINPYEQLMPVTPGANTYIVKGGDTLWEIATNLHTTVQYLAGLNNIPNPDRIYPGQIIKY